MKLSLKNKLKHDFPILQLASSAGSSYSVSPERRELIMKKMILDQLEQAVTTAHDISFAKKAELLALIAQLKTDAADNRDDLGEELRDSVMEFETAHPDLVELTNRACKMLSDIGI